MLSLFLALAAFAGDPVAVIDGRTTFAIGDIAELASKSENADRLSWSVQPLQADRQSFRIYNDGKVLILSTAIPWTYYITLAASNAEGLHTETLIVNVGGTPPPGPKPPGPSPPKPPDPKPLPDGKYGFAKWANTAAKDLPDRKAAARVFRGMASAAVAGTVPSPQAMLNQTRDQLNADTSEAWKSWRQALVQKLAANSFTQKPLREFIIAWEEIANGLEA